MMKAVAEDYLHKLVCEEAEMGVLGAILLNDECLGNAKLHVLTSQDFSSEGHQIIFENILELYRRGKKVDLITLTDQLKKKSQLEKIGGSAYLAQLQEGVATTTNIEHHAEIVKRYAGLRQIHKNLSGELQKIENGEYERPQEALSSVQRLVTDVGGEVDIRELAPVDIEEYEIRLEKSKGKDLIGYDTGFRILNEHTKGLSGLWVVGGGPKTHKSTFALQIASHVAEQKIPILYYDLENGRQRILERLHCRFGAIRWGDLLRGTYDPEDYSRGMDKLKELQPYFYIIDDRKTLTLETIEMHVRAIRERHKTEDLLIVFDPLQKLPSKQKERRLQVDEWLRNFEILKNEFGCAIIVVSELRREQAEYGKVSINDFKESGDIEYTGETLIGICKPDSSRTEYKIKILASRDGETGDVATYVPQIPYWYLEEKIGG